MRPQNAASKSRALAVAALAAALALAGPADAAYIHRTLSFDEVNQGQMNDMGPVGSMVTVEWTGYDGKPTGDPPETQKVGSDGFARFRVPKGHGIADANQTTTLPDPGTNSLRIEAFTISGPDLIVTMFTSAVFEIKGYAPVSIPDLYADTNGNGVLDDDDHLYSAVNLYPYMAGNVSFNLGDSFNIVDGVSAALPGMVFGTSPISLDDTSPDGFDNPSPYSGSGTASSMHMVEVPEPSALALLSFGGLGLLRRRKGRITVS